MRESDAAPSRTSGSHPKALASESRLRPRENAQVTSGGCEVELHQVAERFRAGDFHGALLVAMHALDAGPIPFLNVSPTYLAKTELTTSERILVALVSGRLPLEEIIEASGLGLLEGIDAMSELVELGIIGFDPGSAREPKTVPSDRHSDQD